MTAQQTEHKSFGNAAEARTIPNNQAEIVKVGDMAIGRLMPQPGWRWSKRHQADRWHGELRGAAP